MTKGIAAMKNGGCKIQLKPPIMLGKVIIEGLE